jgi:hypothetical protein
MQGRGVRDIWRFAPLPPNMTVDARNGNTQMASDKHRQQPPRGDTSGKPTLRPHPEAAPQDSKSEPHPPPEDEYGGGDIVSPEPPEPTEDDKPLS